MTYTVRFTEKAKKIFEKLDKYTQLMLITWIEKNLEGTSDPRLHGKALTGTRKGQWRYRVGDYRIIAIIEDGKLVITVITVGHRRNVYVL